ncbi:gamma carbonic anhydrase family protein [candidate division KSB1 bacterium]|nr:gamma carbonic anhydrase family protein [candidate division KSB1 bacterium]
MIIKHLDKIPQVHKTAYVAQSATICGDVTIGKNSRIMHNSSIVAEGSSIEIGDNCIVLENAVIRSTAKYSTSICNNVLIGPNAHLVGCSLEECVFIATGAAIFHGARIGYNSEVRINGIVHLKTLLPPNSMVPINWIAVGNPAQLFSPDQHEQLWEIQKELNFPLSVYGVDRPATGESNMQEITEYYSKMLSSHKDDEFLGV